MIIGDMEIRLRADIARLQADMDSARRVVGGAVDSIARAANMAKGALAGMAAGLSLGALAHQVIDAQREFDKLNASLVTATGSTAGAAQAFKALQSFAATTPYSVQEATEAFIKMRSLGLDPSEKALRSYGNTASSMGKGLNQMIEAVADAATGEFERLKEFGIKSQQNGAQVSLTFKGVTTNIGNNAKEIQAYLQKLGETDFAGAMERRAATLDGAISNLGDTWAGVMRDIAHNGVGDAAKEGVTQLGGALNDLGAILDTVGGKAKAEGKAVSDAGVLHSILTTVFETVAVVGVNVAYVLEQLGKEIAGIAAQANAVLHGDFAQAGAISDMMKKDADEARKAVDAKTEAILHSSEKAQIARDAEAANLKKNGTDQLAQYQVQLSAEEKRKNALNALIEVRKKLLGIDPQDQADMKKIQTALDTGAISQAEYNRLKGQLGKQMQANSQAYKQEQKSLDGQVAAIQRATEAQGLLNQRQQEHVQFLRATGQINDETAINAGADTQVKNFNDQIAAQEKLLGIAKKRQDSQKEQEDINGRVANLRLQVDNAQAKREDDLIALDDRQYREAVGHYADLLEAAQAQSKVEQDRVRDQQDEIDQLGMTSKQIAEVTAKRLQDRAAMLDQLATIRDMQDASGELGAEARKQAEALRAQAGQVITKEEITRQKELWGAIESTAHDTFISIFDSGKSAFDRLRDTLKNGLLELLYQMTLKKWIFDVGTSVSGPGAVGGLAGAGNSLIQAGGSLSGLYSSLTGGMSAAGGLGTGFMGSLAGGLNGAGVGSGLTSSIGLEIGNSIAGVVGPSVSSAIASGLGAVGTALPWIGVGVAALTIGKAAFGMGSKQTTSTGISGTLSDSGVTGQSYTDWTKKGGWFRSDQHGQDKAALSADMVKQFTQGLSSIELASSGFAKSLGVNADSIASYSKTFDIKLTGDATKDAQAITDFFNGIGDEIANKLVPNLDQFSKSGETASATLQRLASDFQGTDQVARLLGVSAEKLFGAAGMQSAGAREQMIDAAGGLQALGQQAQSFNQNFLTDAERAAPVAAALDKALGSLGLDTIPTTRDEFKGLVDDLIASGAVATEAGAKQVSSLLALADAFAQVHPAADAAAEALRKAADALQAMKDSAITLLGDVDGAYSVLEKVVGREKAAIQVTVDAHSAAVSRLQSLSQALHSTFNSMQSPDQQLAGRAAGQAQIRAALAIARAGGPLPAADSLKDALSAVQKDAEGQFSSYTDYLRDLYQTQSDIAALGDVTDDQLSVEQKALTAAQEQLKSLDGVLSNAQQQIDEMKGQSTTLLSIDEAIRALAQAIQGAGANPIVASTAAINGAYQQYLGRAPDAGGLQYWQDAAAGGTPITKIVDDIKGSTEASLDSLYQSVLGRAPDAAGLQFWMNAYGAKMDAAEQADWMKAAQKDPGYKLNSFAVGTNVVPHDMLAQIHKDERIIPAADNRELMSRLSSPSDNSAALVAAIKELQAEVRTLREANSAENGAIAKHTLNTSDHLEAAVNGDTPLATKVISA